MSDLAPDRVRPLLRGGFGDPYRYVVETPSTQQLLADTDLAEGAVAVAEHQTAGRGRLGRRWSDAPGCSLLCSVLLRPVTAREVAQLSLVVGVAVAVAVEASAGVTTMLKWPNDVLVEQRKLAGVLLERGEGSVVCGIGVNVNQTRAELPPGRIDTTSLRLETGGRQDRAVLLVELLDQLELRYRAWLARGLGSVLDDLERRDALSGRPIRTGDVSGNGAGIDASGALLVAQADGTRVPIASGEVETI